MKNPIPFLFLSLSLILSGCVAGRPQPIALAAITEAAMVGSAVALNDSPELRPAFQTAHDDLGALLATGSLNAAQLTKILNELPIKELQGSNARIIIGATLVLFDSYIQTATDINKVAAVKDVAQALYSGLDAALTATPAQLKATKAANVSRPVLPPAK